VIFFYPEFSVDSFIRPVRRSSIYRGAEWPGRKTDHLTVHGDEAKNVCTRAPHSYLLSGHGA